jgi:hypothetical protein
MHRSGTSFLTGSLQQAGLELHRYHEYNPHNLKGNRENQQIVDLNEWVLADSGGSWDSPPEQPVWSDKQLRQARDIIDQYRAYPLWGFKDPRCLVTLDGWRRLLPQLEFIGIFRHPLAVARSLRARNEKTSLEQGLKLWLRYNQHLVALAGQLGFPLLRFDQPAPLLQRQVLELAWLLELPQPEAISFFSKGLVQQDAVSEAVPESLQPIWRKLNGLALD